MCLDDESTAHQRGYEHSQQARRSQRTDIAVHCGENALEVVALADAAGILRAVSQHQLIGKVIIPA